MVGLNTLKTSATKSDHISHKSDLTINEGLVMKDNLIVIPQTLRARMLELIHESHLGIVKCKQLARSSVFWPGINNQIEDVVARCQVCQNFRNKQHAEPMICHNIPTTPYQKVGIDLFQIQDRTFLLAVDYFSKFPEISEIQNTSSKTTIQTLKEIFCRHGIPVEVVSDNGPQFACHEYRSFANEFGFKPIYSNPLFPQSNGQAERCVQTVKAVIKKSVTENKDYNISLLNYRNTPLDKLDKSPAQILMSRNLISKIPTAKKNLKPQLTSITTDQIHARQAKQKHYFDKQAGKQHPILPVNTPIRYLNHKGCWSKATIVKTGTPHSRDYTLQNTQNKYLRRNRKHIFKIPPYRTNYKKQTMANEQIQKSHKQLNKPSDQTPYITRYGRTTKPVIRLGY